MSSKPMELFSQPAKGIEPGQLWRLGEHLLYCGDSSSQEFVWLSRQAEASFAFADPPDSAKVAEWDRKFTWKYDYLIDCAPIVAVTPSLAAINHLMCMTGMPYKWSMCYWLRNCVSRPSLVYVALFATVSLYRNTQDFRQVDACDIEEDGLKHVSRKPIEMMLHLIQLFTQYDQVVIDPFLGSGTTLMACEQVGRTCVGAEQDIEYCASIIR